MLYDSTSAAIIFFVGLSAGILGTILIWRRIKNWKK